MAQLETAIQNPLLLEIANLKTALAGYQQAVDISNLNLQRQAFDTSTVVTRCSALEQENALLRAEVALLRSVPEAEVPTSAIQVSELTLALRRVSDQLNLSEDSLRDQTEQLSRALSAKSQAKHELEGAYAIAARARGREEEAKTRTRELELEVKKKEEEGKLADLVVREYADLVRTIEGRSRLSVSQPPPVVEGGTHEGSIHSQESSAGSSGAYSHSRQPSVQTDLSGAKPIDKLNEGRIGLQRLLSEFHEQTEKMEEQMARLHGEVETLEMRLRSREQTLADTVTELGDARSKFATAVREDKSAAKIVERYMAFSQQSTNLLQTALQNQKKRHAATIATYDRQVSALNQALDREKEHNDDLRSMLGDLTLDVSRESFGRRREISLRLALLRRERKIATMIESWIDLMERHSESDSRALRVEEARRILCILREEDEVATEDAERDAGINAIMLEVNDMRQQLAQELERRLELERRVASVPLGAEDPPLVIPQVDAQSVEQALQSPPTVPTTPTKEGLSDAAPLQPTDHAEKSITLQRQSIDVVINETKVPVDDSSPLVERLPSPQPPPPATASDATPSEQPPSEIEVETSLIIQALKKKRPQYSTLQSAFDGCHDSISQLQSSIRSTGSNASTLSKYINAAVERLNDYCEDARVELEILISDEARIAQGYETLLQLGRSASSTTSLSTEASVSRQEALYEKMNAFTDGSEPSISKAVRLFEEKLDNLLHDIAIIKRAVHEDMVSPTDEEDSTSGTIAVDSTDLPNGRLSMNGGEFGLSWRTITSSILSPTSAFTTPGKNRPVSPSHARTSSSSIHRQAMPSRQEYSHPLNHLGLKVAMPKLPSPYNNSPYSSSFNIHSPFPLMSPRTSGLVGEPKSAPLSRVGSGTSWFSPGASSSFVRSRTISNVHAVGFGVGMNISPINPPPTQGKDGSKIVDPKIPLNNTDEPDDSMEQPRTETLATPKVGTDDVE